MDSRFQSVFEDIYTGDALQDIPWFHILGNHDHKGNHSAQIAYMNKSYRWFIFLYYLTLFKFFHQEQYLKN